MLTATYTAVTDADGQVAPPPEALDGAYTWFVTATAGGRLAWRGWSPVWRDRVYDAEYNQTKVYTITDRPVYRPDQSVKYKLWARNARYDEEGPSAHAGRTFTLEITNPRGEKVLETERPGRRVRRGRRRVRPPARRGARRLAPRRSPGWAAAPSASRSTRSRSSRSPSRRPTEPAALGEKIAATITRALLLRRAGHGREGRLQGAAHAARGALVPARRLGLVLRPRLLVVRAGLPLVPRLARLGRRAPAPFWWPQPSAPPELVAEQEARDRRGRHGARRDRHRAR